MSSPNNLGIREGGRGDAALLSEIHRESFPNYWNPEAFTDFFAVAGTLVLIAEEGGKAAGMMVCRLQFEEAEIITLGVRPAFRHCGIARGLLVEAMKRAHAFGCTHMFLDVEEGNAAAVALYESHGFNHLRRRKQYYRQKDGSFTDALVMRRKLA